MKRILSLSIVFLLALLSLAQTQQGIVKTRGRMVNGQLVAGQRLTGATVTLNFGNPLVSGNQGLFSFNVPSGKNYSLVAAKKQGYTLADPEYTRRSFSYSASNPFYVVLEDEVQRQADINAATRKVCKTLIVQLEKREKEIELLKEQNKISKQEYQRRIKELYDAQEQSQQLVKEMAERYASTDYDQLDEFQRQIQMYIEEGELLKADSMIQSKGSLDKRVKEYHDAVSANKKELERLEQSKVATAKFYDELSQDLYNKHIIAVQQYQWNEALNYMKLRADMDTLNVVAVWDYATLCSDQKKFEDCEKYYLICLHASIASYHLPTIATAQNSLGLLYHELNDYAKSEKYFKLALEIKKLLFDLNPDAYRESLAMTQNNLGRLYTKTRNYENSDRYLKLALKNYEQLFKQNPNAYRADLAEIQNNLGNLYLDLQDYANCEKFYKLTLANKELLFKQNPDAYRASLAMVQNNLGNLYTKTHDYENSDRYLKLALKNKELLFKQNPDAYRADIALTQMNIGNLYSHLHDYANSEKYYKLTLENREILFKQNPDAYRSDLADIYWNAVLLYDKVNNKEEYDKYLALALSFHRDLYNSGAPVILEDLINLQIWTIWRMLEKGNIAEALPLAKETYRMDESNVTSKQYLAECYNRKAYEYANKSDFVNAHKFIDQAISLFPKRAKFHHLKGSLLLNQGKNAEALSEWNKVLQFDPNFLKIHPNGTDFSNSLKKLGLIK